MVYHLAVANFIVFLLRHPFETVFCRILVGARPVICGQRVAQRLSVQKLIMSSNPDDHRFSLYTYDMEGAALLVRDKPRINWYQERDGRSVKKLNSPIN